MANLNRAGRVQYTGLGAGRYTVVVGTSGHYATRSFRVREGQRKGLGSVVLDTPTLTLRGRAAPKAVALVDELEVQEDTEGVLRAIPVSPLELKEAFPDDVGVPEALPVEIEEEVVPRAVPIDAEEGP